MGWANEMAAMIRQQNGLCSEIKLASMTGPTSCKLGNLELTKDDLLFSDRLLAPTCSKVAETAPGGGGACTDKSTYIPVLKAGDLVAIYQISDDKFLVLGRVVSA